MFEILSQIFFRIFKIKKNKKKNSVTRLIFQVCTLAKSMKHFKNAYNFLNIYNKMKINKIEVLPLQQKKKQNHYAHLCTKFK